VVNVFWLRLTHTNPITVNDLSALATSMDTLFNTTWRPQVSASYTATSIDIKFYPGGGTVLEYSKSITRTGAGATAVQDAGASYVVNWIIGSLYRGGHPRSYWAGVDNATVTSGSDVTTSALSAVAAGAEAFRNGINAFTSTNATAVEMGTVRFQSADTWLTPPVFYPYTGSKVRSKLGSQRRRILG
jgi:hypothetical protein